MKKICFISKDANWQQYRNEVLTELGKKYGYKIDILTTGKIKDYLRSNDVVKYITFSSLFPLKWKINFFPGALIHIIKNKPDYVLALPNISNLTEYISVFICKLLGIPILFWTHGYDHGIRRNNLFNKIRVKIMEFFYKKVDHIIVFSYKGKEYLINKGIDSNKITVAPNTLNTNFWLKKYYSCNKNEIKKKYGYTNNSFHVLFSGRLNKFKKVINLLKAGQIIQNKFKNLNIYIHIVGDGEEKENLQNFVNKNNLKNVIFYGAIFDEAKVADIFCLSDVFVMPGYVGLAIIHAFCFGLPIITENLSYHSPEICFLKHNINGFFVEEDNIEELANKIIFLFQNKEVLKELSKSAIETVKNEASIENMIKKMNEAFLKSEWK
jgi:1,2-diacylglycerol 3-alpha-glucosyltransferase